MAFPDISKKNSSLQGIQKLNISPILQKVIAYTAQDQPYLITYDAKTARFIYWTNLLPVYGHTFIGKVQEMTTNMQHFPFYEPVVITIEEFRLYWQLYKRYCRQFAISGYYIIIRVYRMHFYVVAMN